MWASKGIGIWALFPLADLTPAIAAKRPNFAGAAKLAETARVGSARAGRIS